MRKNTARHWLHAILDLLPVLVIPIFALQVRSDNGFTPITIEVDKEQVINFNQLIPSRDNVSYYGIDFTYDSGKLTADGTASTTIYYPLYRFTLISGHKYSVRFNSIPVHTSDSNNIYLFNGVDYLSDTTNQHFVWTQSSDYNAQITWKVNNGVVVDDNYAYLQLFDLTDMGLDSLNLAQFDSLFSDNYYSYTIGTKMLVNTGVPIVYDKQDVGSQMVYTLYETVDSYFNMGNVFGMNNVYQWFEVNIFGATPSLAIYIVWNIVLYEFVMDLLFLLYGLFMWFVDMLKRLMEKPIDSIK